MGESQIKWQRICKKNSGKQLLACIVGKTSSESTTQGLSWAFCPSVFLSAFCHSLPFSFPDFVFVLKIGFFALIAHLPTDLCLKFLHSPASQPLTHTVKSIWQGMSNTGTGESEKRDTLAYLLTASLKAETTYSLLRCDTCLLYGRVFQPGKMRSEGCYSGTKNECGRWVVITVSGFRRRNYILRGENNT